MDDKLKYLKGDSFCYMEFVEIIKDIQTNKGVVKSEPSNK